MRLSLLLCALCAPLLGLAGCSDDDDDDGPAPPDTTAPVFTGGPSVAPNPNASVPLAALLTVATDEPTRLTVEIDDGLSTWTVTPSSTLAAQHTDEPILRLKADRTHMLTVTAEDAAGNSSTAAPIPFQTQPLPDPFPPIQVTTSNPAAMEPGVTLFNARLTSLVIPADTFGLLVIVDEAGEPVWFYQTGHAIDDARRLSNGNLIYMYNRVGIVEIDMLGNEIAHWWASGGGVAPPSAVVVATDSFHHEVFELPASDAGDFLTVSTERLDFPSYPVDEADPGTLMPNTKKVISDVLVEFTRDGTIVREWSLVDSLDPFRISYGSLSNFWDAYYGEPTADWAHVNAVIVDFAADAWIVSARHQEAVVSIDRTTGALNWIMGPPEGWVPPYSDKLLDPGMALPGVAPFEWFFHQHAPVLLPNGEILLFDNGNGRAVAPDPELPVPMRYSRAAQYAVDTLAQTATMTWSYGDLSMPEFYSAFLGDADFLPSTGNVLICDGANAVPGVLTARLIEVTHELVPQVVFEIEVRDLTATNGWTIYRAERLPDVYP